MKILKYIIMSVILGFAIFFGLGNIQIVNNPEILGSVNAQKCSVSSTQVALVGHQLSSTILSANETRAYAKIQQPVNATNTVSLSFDEGAAAVLNRGIQLYGVYSTTSPSIEFGRATDFPYTGAITGITNLGSTTVLITECSY